ncbi:MAG: xanthine dehydrogenase family protein subunit M [Nitrospirota bacterium]
MLPRFSYVRPASLKEALGHLGTPGALVQAGGTDLLGCLRDRVFGIEKMVSLSALKELGEIRETPDGGLLIGALATVAQAAAHPTVLRRYPGLAQGAGEVASPQLRNQGTMGGNLCQKPRCWYYRGDFFCIRKGGDLCYAEGGENQFHCILGGGPCFIVHPSDTAPPLVALGAAVRISGPGGTRSVPVEGFHVLPEVDATRETVLEPGEVVTGIDLPPSPAGLRSSYRKVRARRAWDFALAGVALALTMESGRVKAGHIVLGGAAPVPWRAREAEDAITGRRLDEAAADRAARAALTGAQAMSKNAYKLSLFRGLVKEELLKQATA